MSDTIQSITMPKWGLAMTEGLVSAWHVNVGDELKAGDEALDIETEKITNAFESPASGTLRRHVVEVGETVPVGALLGVIADPEVPESEIDGFIEAFQANFKVEAAEIQAAAPSPETVDVGKGMVLRYLHMGETENEPIVLIHGFGGDLNNWLFNQPALAETHSVYALDLPGHGGSTKSFEGAAVGDLANVVQQFANTMTIGPMHLVGHSLGAAIAMQLALDAPERVRSVTLIAPAGLGADINMAYIDGFISANRRKELRPVVQTLFAESDLVRREMLDDLLKFKRLDGVPQALRLVADTVFAGGRQTTVLKERASELTMPVQVVWGEQDQIIPSHHAEGLAQSITIHTFPDAGHMAHMEKAAEVTALIQTFVAA